MPLTEEQEKDIDLLCDHMRAWRDQMLLGRNRGEPDAFEKLVKCECKFRRKYFGRKKQ